MAELKTDAPRLLAILDWDAAGGEGTWMGHLTALVGGLPDDGSVWLQLRAKSLPRPVRSRVFRVARLLASRRPELPVLVNGTSNEAVEARFRGLHWAEAVRPDRAPPAIGQLRWISAAVHDVDGAKGAQRAGAQVVTWSPVFEPGSKPAKGRGVQALASFVAESPLPVLALGGLREDRVASCIQAGASGVAVLSAISRPGAQPVEVATRLIEAVRASR